MHTPPPPFPPFPAAGNPDDGLLSELASLTGLFTPEVIWQEEEQLDDLDEPAAPPHPGPADQPRPVV